MTKKKCSIDSKYLTWGVGHMCKKYYFQKTCLGVGHMCKKQSLKKHVWLSIDIHFGNFKEFMNF